MVSYCYQYSLILSGDLTSLYGDSPEFRGKTDNTWCCNKFNSYVALPDGNSCRLYSSILSYFDPGHTWGHVKSQMAMFQNSHEKPSKIGLVMGLVSLVYTCYIALHHVTINWVCWEKLQENPLYFMGTSLFPIDFPSRQPIDTRFCTLLH